MTIKKKISLIVLLLAVISMIVLIFLMVQRREVIVEPNEPVPKDNSYVFADHEALATDYASLKTALEDAGITVIYMGADIKLTGGVEINAKKTSLIIDGTNPRDEIQTRYTLTEYNSSAQDQTITLRSNDALKTITIRNIKIEASNYYGTVCIYDTVKNCEMEYDNIDYRGPQLTYNRYGTSVYRDCRITIGSFGGASPANEVGEVSNVRLEGTVRFEQAEAQANEIFYVPVQAGIIEIMPGADVEVITIGESGFINTAVATTMTVHHDATFRYSGVNRFWDGTAMRGMTVESGGSAYLECSGVLQATLLRLNGDLLVEEDATLHLTNRENSAFPLIYLSGGSLTFHNPKSVMLYSQNYRAIAFETTNTFSITGQQVNYWDTLAEEGLDNLPLYGWRKQNGGDLEINGTMTAGAAGMATSVTSNYGEEDHSASAAPSDTTLNFYTMRIMAVGRLDISADYLYRSASEYDVYGITLPASQVRLDQDAKPLTEVKQSDEIGEFSFLNVENLQAGDVIQAKSTKYYLFAEMDLTMGGAKLSFQTSSEPIRFYAEINANNPTIYRDNDAWPIMITDSRPVGTEWKLYVKELQPFTNADTGQTILNALFYVNGQGESYILRAGETVLAASHTSVQENEVTMINWEAQEGILASIPAGIAYAGRPYHASLQWTLVDAP